MAGKDEKFLFNVHVFDAEDAPEPEEIAEDVPPPPPVFSEAELAAARRKSFNEGKAEAEAAFQESHEKKIAATLDVLVSEISSLFSAEAARERRFEREVVELADALFSHVYPLYKEMHGFDALLRAITDIVTAQQGQARIRIQVHGSVLDGVQTHLAQMKTQQPDLNFTVEANDALDETACKLDWDHGGAYASPEDLALKIKALLQETLAKNAPNRHDKNIAPRAAPRLEADDLETPPTTED